MSTGHPTDEHPAPRDAHRCPVCGHGVWPDDAFCTGCGTPLSPSSVRRPLFADEVEPGPRVAPEPAPTTALAAEEPPRRRRGGVLLTLVVVLLLAAAGIGYAVGHHGDDAAPSAGSSAGTSSAPSAPTGRPAQSPPAAGATGPAPAPQPQDRLQAVSRRDDAAVRRLVGSWVPQLAALAPGAGSDRSWTEALASYRELRETYPSALLLDTGRWPHSYEHGGMYAVVVPRPGATSRPALAWCRGHHLASADCAAKLIDTSGTWADNFDSGAPGPD